MGTSVTLSPRSSSSPRQAASGRHQSLAGLPRIRVASRWFGNTPSDADIKQVEQNPPITQTGNSIKIDQLPDEPRWRGISGSATRLFSTCATRRSPA